MKTARALWLCFVLLPLAAFAAEQPEVVYGKFHRAAVTGDLQEMMRYAHAAQRAEIAGMSAAQKEAQATMMSALLPRAYLLQSKTTNKGGQGALLLVSGPAAEKIVGHRPEMLYGSIQMMLEGGEWKVGEMNWTNTKPAGMQVKAAPGAPATKAPATSAPRGTVVGTQPERKFGTAKPTCVYKAVMTAEDVENCR